MSNSVADPGCYFSDPGSYVVSKKGAGKKNLKFFLLLTVSGVKF
jgi:hypothetical protein